MVEERIRKHFDYALLAVVMTLMAFGATMVSSAAHTDSAGTGVLALVSSKYFKKQIIWAVFGLIGMTAASMWDYRSLTRFARPIYIGNVLLLLMVAVKGHAAKGSQRWISLGFFDLQPSELAKVALVITLACALLANLDKIKELDTVFRTLVHIGVPALLILKQPDLGTSLVLMAIWLGMLFVAGAKKRHLVLFAMIGILLFGVMWQTGFIKDYQKNRLTSFIDPSADPQATGYHVTQSLVAIGSGELSGKGLFQGSQNRLHFIPEQHTDFIFTVVGEELGFLGTMAALMLYLILLWRILIIMMECEDRLGRLIAAGIFAMFTFHVVENLGMTLGVMPVAGVPLPFMSYGGSSMIVNMTAIGLLESIHLRRHKIMF